MTFVGIDVSKSSLDAAAIMETGEVEQRPFTNDPTGHTQLMAWLTGFPDRLVTLEATGSYHQRLSAVLQEAREHVSVLNPAQVSYFAKSQARRNKTDRVDALMLAVYGKERRPAPSLATNTGLQSLARELNALQEDITRLKNRLEAAEHGLTHPEVAASIKRRIAALEEEKAALQKNLEREARCVYERDLTLLESIPGIGTRSACLFLAEVGDIRRFPSAPKLVAFAGLSPMEVRSGSSVNKQTRISRLGSSALRRILYMPGLVGIRHNPILKAFYERLVAKGKNKKAALLACVAKLLRIMYGVLIHQRPFDATYTAG